MSMTLDAGAAEWIGDNHVALGTMDGKLFILTLVTDSSETVRSLDLEHVFGIASVRYDTMHLLGVSVNVFDEQVAIVWQVGNLPMDCNR
ncbi:hypothetical protein ANCDUO_22325 [Ancylostoma duodenale]|uniref:Uncharacterized protein n=1 Tax=Ancylostoma duodenale TaxID=51022 RepID=A0A0C2CCM1_9BILA|nr:hypothetical protein ANCDUO_22325 [Ancylostoma duodenale]